MQLFIYPTHPTHPSHQVLRQDEAARWTQHVLQRLERQLLKADAAERRKLLRGWQLSYHPDRTGGPGPGMGERERERALQDDKKDKNK